jgi:hypothetical protein
MIDAQIRSGIDHQIVLLSKFILSAPNDRQGVPGTARFVADDVIIQFEWSGSFAMYSISTR